MTADELRYLIFEKLYAELSEDKDDPSAFVGLQGDVIVVMQKGGAHLAVSVVPASVGVAS